MKNNESQQIHSKGQVEKKLGSGLRNIGNNEQAKCQTLTVQIISE